MVAARMIYKAIGKRLNRQISFEKLAGEELSIVLTNRLGCCSYTSKNSYVLYGSHKEVRVQYKLDSNKVVEIDVSQDLGDQQCDELFELINNFLIKKNGTYRVRHLALFSNYPFYGSIHYENLFVLGEVPPGSPLPAQTFAPHPLIIQHWCLVTGISCLDSYRKDNDLDEIIYLLAVFCDVAYEKAPGFGMCRVLENDKRASRLMQQGYSYDRSCYSPDAFFFGREVEIIESKSLFDLYFKLKDSNVKRMFKAGCEWYYKSKIASSATEKYVNCIVAIESVLASQGVRDVTNHTKKSGVTTQFKEFLKEYAGVDNEGLLNKLYKIRSNVLHNGRTIASGRSFYSQQLAKERDLLMCVEVICRTSLINWLSKKSEVDDYKVVCLSEGDLLKQYFEKGLKLSRKIDQQVDKEVKAGRTPLFCR